MDVIPAALPKPQDCEGAPFGADMTPDPAQSSLPWRDGREPSTILVVLDFGRMRGDTSPALPKRPEET